MIDDWTRDLTMAYLNANPLPVSFTWTHRDGGERPVQPSHRSVIGYGKWLRETPYFPGVFELIHDVLARAEVLGDGEWMVSQIRARLEREEQEKLKF